MAFTTNILAKTAKYEIEIVNGLYRVNNKSRYKKEVPFIEIPKEMVDDLLIFIKYYRLHEITRPEGITEFNNFCDIMFDDEHTELYPESVL